MKRLVLIAVLLLCCAPLSHALSRIDGNRLLHDCQAGIKFADGKDLSRDEAIQSSECLAYVEGSLDGSDFWKVIDQRDGNKNMPHHCIPNGVTMEQTVRVLMKYLEGHPQELHENGWVCVHAAMLEAFPCKG
jgi:hypothetical protein